MDRTLFAYYARSIFSRFLRTRRRMTIPSGPFCKDGDGLKLFGVQPRVASQGVLCSLGDTRMALGL